MTHYGIIGSGTCGENIIEDGLADIGLKGNTFLIAPRRGASASEERVYDYLLENDATYNAYYRSTTPKVLVDKATDSKDCTSLDPWEEIIKELQAVGGSLLVLWDADNEAHLTEFAFKALDAGIQVKELSNGLAPMTVEAPEEQEPTMQPFSSEELESMSIGVLRKAAAAQGIEAAGTYEKHELIDMITTGTTNKSTTSNPIGDTKVTVTQTVSTSYGEGSITWIEDGKLFTKKLSSQEVAWATKCLQELPTS